VATFTLKHGESMTAVGLPADAQYTVSEETNLGLYEPKCTNPTGAIAEGQNTLVAFTNHFIDLPPTGDSSNLTLYVALLALCGAGLALLALAKRRTRG